MFTHDSSLRKTFTSRAKGETGYQTAVHIATSRKARDNAGRHQDLTEYRVYASEPGCEAPLSSRPRSP